MKSFLFVFLLSILSIFAKKKMINIEFFEDDVFFYPPDSEIQTTMMCLKYHGFNISSVDFVDNYLETGELYYKNNVLYGPDPNKKFAGSPYGKEDYGCYEPVIENALNKYFKENNINNYIVKNLNKAPMKLLIDDYIDKDIPVIFWTTLYLLPSVDVDSWIDPETNEKIIRRENKICILFIGYDDESDLYYFHVPFSGASYGYNKKLLERRHKELFSMAAAIIKVDD